MGLVLTTSEGYEIQISPTATDDYGGRTIHIYGPKGDSDPLKLSVALDRSEVAAIEYMLG